LFEDFSIICLRGLGDRKLITVFEYIFQVTSGLAGARPRDGRPPLPAAAAVGQARDSTTGANEDEPEISEAAKNLLKQQVQSLSAKVEEVAPLSLFTFLNLKIKLGRSTGHQLLLSF